MGNALTWLRNPILSARHWLTNTALRHTVRFVVWLRRKSASWRWGESIDYVTVNGRAYAIRVLPKSVDDHERAKVRHADTCDFWQLFDHPGLTTADPRSEGTT